MADSEARPCPNHSYITATTKCAQCLTSLCSLCIIVVDGEHYCSRACAPEQRGSRFLGATKKGREKRVMVLATCFVLLTLGLAFGWEWHQRQHDRDSVTVGDEGTYSRAHLSSTQRGD